MDLVLRESWITEAMMTSFVKGAASSAEQRGQSWVVVSDVGGFLVRLKPIVTMRRQMDKIDVRIW